MKICDTYLGRSKSVFVKEKKMIKKNEINLFFLRTKTIFSNKLFVH